MEEAKESEIFEGASADVTFNLNSVHDSFRSSLLDNEDVEIGCYIVAYKELYNFFLLLGSAFGFVASDVKSKIKILEDLRNGKNKNVASNFVSVKKMIAYERDNKLFDEPKYVNGSRTLLRLHRGLNFIRQFLGEIQTLENHVRIGGVCKETYDRTLAPYHTWIVKKAATLAMHLLPTKEDLVKKMVMKNMLDVETAMTVLPAMLEVSATVYNRVEKIYTENNLHDLK